MLKTCPTDIVGQCKYCWTCGTQPYWGPPIPRDPAALMVGIDSDKLNARRATRRAMMAGGSGPRHETEIADEVDKITQASFRERKDWGAATDEDVFDWCCVLDSQRNGTTWAHGPSCQCVGLTHGNACPPRSSGAKQ